ncbi:MAG: hypothetical protein LBK66_10440 [Spirochaetaceae bacterium]|jgi:hypothetical protein|nr:hypothetical protein [Spirochaetaceae bacterium]
MAHNFTGILKTISAEHGIAGFKDRKLFVSILKEYKDQTHTKEIRLLQRLSNLGYVSGAARKDNTPGNIEFLARQLHDDECVDLDVALEVTEALFSVINEAREQEKLRIEEMEEQAREAEIREQIIIAQRKHETLEKLLASLLKIHGVNALNNPAFCRAWLKDTAMGDLIDEITVLSLLLEAKVQRRILKHRIFKSAREKLVKQLEQEFCATHESLLTPILNSQPKLYLRQCVNTEGFEYLVLYFGGRKYDSVP